MNSQSELNEDEYLEFSALVESYLDAKANSDFVVSDAKREELIKWGATPPSFTHWHPVFEDKEHRSKRLESRGK